MLVNVKRFLTKKEKAAIGGFYHAVRIKNGWFFPLSGYFLKDKTCAKNSKKS